MLFFFLQPAQMPLFMFFFFFFLLLFLPSSSLPPSPLPDRRNSLSPFFLRHSLTCLGLCKVYVWKTIFDAWRVVVDQGMDNVAVGRAGNSCSTKIRAHEYTPKECHRSLLRGGGRDSALCQSLPISTIYTLNTPQIQQIPLHAMAKHRHCQWWLGGSFRMRTSKKTHNDTH